MNPYRGSVRAALESIAPAKKVAIGLPVYNGEKWLPSTLESILDQTYDDFDLLISDNASTDATRSICQELALRDDRIRYVQNERNVGVFGNFDLAFHRTNSKYFKWCAVGDAWDKHYIEKAVEVLDRDESVVLVHSRATTLGHATIDPRMMTARLHLVQDDPTERYREYLINVRLNNIMFGLIRSDQLRRTALNRVFHASDVCMIAELALRGKFVEIPEVLFYRRMDQRTSTLLKNAEDTLQFFSEEPTSPSAMWHWKIAQTLVSRLMVSPVTATQKLGLLRFLTKRMFWERQTLMRELKDYLRTSLALRR